MPCPVSQFWPHLTVYMLIDKLNFLALIEMMCIKMILDIFYPLLNINAIFSFLLTFKLRNSFDFFTDIDSGLLRFFNAGTFS